MKELQPEIPYIQVRPRNDPGGEGSVGSVGGKFLQLPIPNPQPPIPKFCQCAAIRSVG
jgi:hypothetical protein